MNIDLRQVRYAVRTAEEGSVTRAAHSLGITQPALSRQLRALEARLGVVLFEKAGRGIRLTSRGHELMPHFRDLLARAAALGERARGVVGEPHPRLDLIAPVQSIEAFLAPALGRFRRAHPDADVTVLEAPADEVQGLLERNRGNMAVAAQPIGPQLPFRILARGTVHVAMARSHPFAGRDALEVRDLDGHALLAMRRGTLSRGLLDSASRLAHMTPVIRHESRSPHALAAMARAGLGLAVMPITARPQSDGLAFARLRAAGTPLGADIAVLWTPALALTGPVEALIGLVADEMHDAPFLEAVPSAG